METPPSRHEAFSLFLCRQPERGATGWLPPAEITGTFFARHADDDTYIYQRPDWPNFRWDHRRLAEPLTAVSRHQGRLIGRMEGLGLSLRSEAVLETLVDEAIKSGDIEGETLDREQVRSSFARRLGMDAAGLKTPDRNVEGIVEIMLDATQNYAAPLTAERLFAWHAALFPTGRSGLSRITVGAWRTGESGPMQIVSGPVGKETIHYEAPGHDRRTPT